MRSASMGPEPRPCSSRNPSSGSLTMSGGSSCSAAWAGASDPVMAPRVRLVAIAAACWLLMLVGGARAVDDHSVTVQNYSFTDATTMIPEGDSVTWHWTGPGTTHSVTSDADSTQAF